MTYCDITCIDGLSPFEEKLVLNVFSFASCRVSTACIMMVLFIMVLVMMVCIMDVLNMMVLVMMVKMFISNELSVTSIT